jgi:hypothetical protein
MFAVRSWIHTCFSITGCFSKSGFFKLSPILSALSSLSFVNTGVLYMSAEAMKQGRTQEIKTRELPRDIRWVNGRGQQFALGVSLIRGYHRLCSSRFVMALEYFMIYLILSFRAERFLLLFFGRECHTRPAP